MYMIFRSLLEYHQREEDLPGNYYYLANYNNEDPWKNFHGHNFSFNETCRVNGKSFKMWSIVSGLYNHIDQTFDKILSVNDPRRNYFIFENLEDANNALIRFENASIEIFGSIMPVHRHHGVCVVNYYIVGINTRQVNIFSVNGEQRIKNIPFEFLEIRREVNLNIENFPYVPHEHAY